jgi:hypothetical protein
VEVKRIRGCPAIINPFKFLGYGEAFSGRMEFNIKGILRPLGKEGVCKEKEKRNY